MKKFLKNKKFKFYLFFLMGLFLFGNFVFAQAPSGFGFEYATGGALGQLGTRDLRLSIVSIVNIFLSFLGVLALTIILYGGFVWMTSGGNPQKVEKAKKIIIAAVIGLILILLAFAIVQFIVSTIVGSTGGGGPKCDATTVGICSGCRRCNEVPAGSGIYQWQNDNTCAPICSGITESLKVESIVPPDTGCTGSNPDLTLPMNVVTRIYFNKSVDPASVSPATIPIQSSPSQCPPGALAQIPGTYTVNGRLVEFRPNPGGCPANSCDATDCLPAFSTIDVNVLIGGVYAMGDPADNVQDNLTVDENIQFFTNDKVDCESPNVFLNAGQICIDWFNNIGASAFDDSGIAHMEFTDDNGNLAYGLGGASALFPCPGPGLCGSFPAFWILNSVNYNPLTVDGYQEFNSYTLTAEVADLDDNTARDNQTRVMRPGHCCNGVKDEDEEFIDCGGLDCEPCSGLPVIDWISPIGGFCDDDPSIPCLESGDCLSGTCNHDTPNGAPGNFLTIGGRYFGNIAGTVSINGVVAQLANTVNSECDSVWTPNQVIVVVPNGISGSGPIRLIEATTGNNFEDTTNNTNGPLIKDFLEVPLERPGLCKVENTEPASPNLGNPSGFFGDSTSGHGINFEPATEIEFGNSARYLLGGNINVASQLEINSTVPNIKAPASVGYRARIDKLYSNYLNFSVQKLETGPRIDYVEPTRGPEGQYVTIYGGNFGNSPAGNQVNFVDGPTPSLADITTFPEECPADFRWRDNFIVVKVPLGINTGSYNIQVTVSGEDSNKVPFDICALNPATCPLLPGMCRLDPVKGPFFFPVDVYGEHFGAWNPLFSDVEFFDGTPLFPNLSAFNIFTWGHTLIRDAQVPSFAKSGPVYVLNDSTTVNNRGNSLPFEVGECKDLDASTDCPAGTVCCPGGACWNGSCPEINKSEYKWSFTTGDYFIANGCDSTDPPGSPAPLTSRDGEACINSSIAVRFTEDINDATITSSNPPNPAADTMLVCECLNEVCSGDIDCSIHPLVSAISLDKIENIPANKHYVVFNPNGNLKKNTYYRVYLRGDIGGIRSATGDPLIDDFTWVFKTRNSDKLCGIGGVAVIPNPAKLVDFEATQTFMAIPFPEGNPCVPINPYSFNWDWENSDIAVARLTNQDILPPAGLGDPIQYAAALSNGKTFIKAIETGNGKWGRATLTVDFQGLHIIDHWPDCDTACSNAFMGMAFDSQVDTGTINLASNNINVYECVPADSKECDNFSLSLPITDPSMLYFWDPVSGHSNLDFSLSGLDFSNNTFYRVITDRGIKNILGDNLSSFNDNLAYGEECDNTAFCNPALCLWNGTSPLCGDGKVDVGEECDDGNNVDNGNGCSANCLHTGSIANTNPGVECGDGDIDSPWEACDYDGICVDGSDNVLGPPYIFCRVGVTNCGAGNNCKAVQNNGCGTNCLLQGSSNTAVCGNGIVEFGEACDDHNQTNDDGCNSRCLREGKKAEIINGIDPNPLYSYICGDGVLGRDANGAGEDCDDGNDVFGDGCNPNCISEGVGINIFSICGDGRVGPGEDCDNTKGCTADTCLNTGSAGRAVCGNGLVEAQENDAYSWIFGAKNEVCDLDHVDVLPGEITVAIGESVDYKVIAFGSPDECDPNGQRLDSLPYNWFWSSDDIAIATITSVDSLPPGGDGNIDPIQIATADPVNEGTTNINAAFGAISDFGIIHVGSGGVENLCIFPDPTNPSKCCNKGAVNCAFAHECIPSDTQICFDVNPNPSEDCRCCCKPLYVCSGDGSTFCESNAECAAIGAGNCSVKVDDECPDPLDCEPDKGLCTSASDPGHRGLCCGCEEDLDCSPINNTYCGTDTCCHNPPYVVRTYPGDGDTQICRNTLVEIEFNEKMDRSTLNKNNIMLLGQIDYLVNFDFEAGAVGGIPAGWARSTQLKSSVGIVNTENNSPGGTKSILIHQDPNLEYYGHCDLQTCSDINAQNGSCSWAGGQCNFPAHPNCPNNTYNVGDGLCQEHANKVMYADFKYDTSGLNWQEGEVYKIQFSYKGNIDLQDISGNPKDLSVILSYMTSFHSQCVDKQSDGTCPVSAAYPDRAECSNNASKCCNQAPFQEDCYTSLNLPSISFGSYPDWQTYEATFVYSDEFKKFLDSSGNPHSEIGIQAYYGKTGPAGVNLYIDDFQLHKIAPFGNYEIRNYNSSNYTTTYIIPYGALESNREYTIFVQGDPDMADNEKVGVKSSNGIVMNGSYSSLFTTGDEICDIDYIQVDLEVGPDPNEIIEDINSDMFTCAVSDNCQRDAIITESGNQHIYHAKAMDIETGGILNPLNFLWSWEETDPHDVFDITGGFIGALPVPLPLTADVYDVEITSNPVEELAYLSVKAKDNDLTDNIDYGNAEKNINIRVFLCENPWPHILYWPWIDDINPASFEYNALALCDPIAGTGACSGTHFEMYYCRDDGDRGTADDLPPIAIDPVVRGLSDDVIKEFFFIIDDENTEFIFDDNVDWGGGDHSGTGNEEDPDSLVLTEDLPPTPYIWIANSSNSSVTRLSTSDGSFAGVFNVGYNPSRTSVDANGSVWVGNRDSNNITKLDQSGNHLKTCIVGPGPRGVAIDENGDVWIGNHGDGTVMRISGDDTNCNILDTLAVGGSPYGAMADGRGNVWVVSRDVNAMIFKINVNTKNWQTFNVPPISNKNYGLTLDRDGSVWVANSLLPIGSVTKLDKNGLFIGTYNTGGSLARGAAIDIDGNIWITNHCGDPALGLPCGFGITGMAHGTVSKLSSNGALLGLYEVGQAPIGVSGDSNGNIWVINYHGGGPPAAPAPPGCVADISNGSVTKIRASDGFILGTYCVGNNPYTYSDMTGFGYYSLVLNNEGTWRKKLDSGRDREIWKTVAWDGTKPPGTNIEVRVRSAVNQGALSSATWTNYYDVSPANLVVENNRWLEVEVKLSTNDTDITPKVEKLTIFHELGF